MSSEKLLELARERFGDELTAADEHLFRQTAIGEVAVYGTGDPADADKWGDDRVLKADRIVWLCTDRAAVEWVTQKGVWISGARIDGELALFFSKTPFPLSIQNSAVPRGIFMQCCHLAVLSLDGTHTGPINADGLSVEHDLNMRNGFRATGEVRLLGARIGGTIDCTNGCFRNPGGDALSVDGAEVGGFVFLRGEFEAMGAVRLLGAKIGGNIECTHGRFSNPGSYALSADGADVGGSVFLRDEFQATGEVRLVGAKIGGDLDCTKGRFCNAMGAALNAECVSVNGSVFLRNEFRAEGELGFTAAHVARYFVFREVRDPNECTLRLKSARIGTLWDEEKSWPAKLYLDGLVYERLESRSPLGAEARLRWLRLQGHGSDSFVPQPYVQLAKVLEEMGHERDARRILIAKQEDPARVAGMSIPQRVMHRAFGLTIGYGYRPWRAIGWIAVFVLFGMAVFMGGFNKNGFAATNAGTVPAFNALVYSFDAFAPLIDLHQAKYRLPTGPWLRGYLWLHIVAGWILTTLLVVGLTGLVRK